MVSLDRGCRTLYAVWDDETHGYYVDADGVTEEFTSEWQAEAYRLELQGQAEQALTVFCMFSRGSSNPLRPMKKKLCCLFHGIFMAMLTLIHLRIK